MDTLNIDALAERVERLERENHRWRWGAGVLLTCCLVAMITGARRADDTKVVEAEQFVVRDKDGKERARLGISSGDCPALFLRGKDGKTRAMLQSSDEDVGGLFLTGRHGGLSVVLHAESRASNSPFFVLRRDDRHLINMNVGSGASLPWLTFQDESGVLFQVPVRRTKPVGADAEAER
jgi:hypothetical protein